MDHTEWATRNCHPLLQLTSVTPAAQDFESVQRATNFMSVLRLDLGSLISASRNIRDFRGASRDFIHLSRIRITSRNMMTVDYLPLNYDPHSQTSPYEPRTHSYRLTKHRVANDTATKLNLVSGVSVSLDFRPGVSSRLQQHTKQHTTLSDQINAHLHVIWKSYTSVV